ncbi:unnamed protein product [Mytilus coruscus]|uniref:Uncharacterized protein n=1 Tax=Mytilus coruscus TaxID=42192 RepID=A0A6J8CHH2_MYTCO|nr:unnamed protein product [Mytilus coruscus]
MKHPKVQMLYGTPTNMQDIIVVDSTYQIRITLWDSIVSFVQVDDTCTFENLSVRNFKNETYLTTTKSSKITRTDSIDDPVEFESTAAVPTTIVGTVAAVRITQGFMCKSCTRILQTLLKEGKYNMCTYCKMLQKTANFVSCLTATLNVTSEDEVDEIQTSKLAIFSTQINNFCTLHDQEEFLDDPLKMEEFFLEDTFDFNHVDNIIDSFTVVKKIQKAIPELTEQLCKLVDESKSVATVESSSYSQVSLLVGKTIRHKFTEGTFIGKVISVVPGFGKWYNVTYDGDPAVYVYQLQEDYADGNIEIVVRWYTAHAVAVVTFQFD